MRRADGFVTRQVGVLRCFVAPIARITGIGPQVRTFLLQAFLHACMLKSEWNRARLALGDEENVGLNLQGRNCTSVSAVHTVADSRTIHRYVTKNTVFSGSGKAPPIIFIVLLSQVVAIVGTLHSELSRTGN